jgi:hypothetical protein
MQRTHAVALADIYDITCGYRFVDASPEKHSHYHLDGAEKNQDNPGRSIAWTRVVSERLQDD